jgi:hypothetical protein
LPAQVADLPPISRSLPESSGLVLVETSHRQAALPIDEPEAPRPKRVRPPRPEVASEPLEIVETRKEPPTPAP